MAKTAVLNRTSRGPGTFTSANFTLPAGTEGSYSADLTPGAAALAREGVILDVQVEAFDPGTGLWNVIAAKQVIGPWTKPVPPSISASWNDPGGVPERTARIVVSLPVQMTMGIDAEATLIAAVAKK